MTTPLLFIEYALSHEMKILLVIFIKKKFLVDDYLVA